MGADLRNFYDPNDKPNDFEVLPEGVYSVKITGSDWKDTRKGDGKYLQFEMTIVEGEHKGNKIFDRFNLVNPSDQAVRIARGQFASLREAVGVLNPKDPAELMNIRFQLVLRCVKRNDRPDEMTNEVKRYIKKGEGPATPPQNDGDAPWARTSSSAPAAPATSSAGAPF